MNVTRIDQLKALNRKEKRKEPKCVAGGKSEREHDIFRLLSQMERKQWNYKQLNIGKL